MFLSCHILFTKPHWAPRITWKKAASNNVLCSLCQTANHDSRLKVSALPEEYNCKIQVFLTPLRPCFNKANTPEGVVGLQPSVYAHFTKVAISHSLAQVWVCDCFYATFSTFGINKHGSFAYFWQTDLYFLSRKKELHIPNGQNAKTFYSLMARSSLLSTQSICCITSLTMTCLSYILSIYLNG